MKNFNRVSSKINFDAFSTTFYEDGKVFAIKSTVDKIHLSLSLPREGEA